MAHEPERLFHADPEYYDERATGLLASARDGTPTAMARFERHDAPLSIDGARRVLAAEHGCGGWADLTARVAALPGSDDPFVHAYRAIEARDRAALAAVLDDSPAVIEARGTNGNTLLGMAGAAGGLALSQPLLDRGADLDAANAHGWTALHQAAYADQTDLARALLQRGASSTIEARGAGGTPLIVALFWGNRATAELLGDHSRAPGNLRVAAGLGDRDAIGALSDQAAAAGRGFYRPHGGFPQWRPDADPQEVRDEALAWAARNRRAGVLAELVARGAQPDADVYRGTALAWAAWTGDAPTIDALIALGADPSGRSGFGGPDHGERVTPLHLAAQRGHAAAIEALLRAGADAALTDARYDASPAGWALEFGQDDALALLTAAGG